MTVGSTITTLGKAYLHTPLLGIFQRMLASVLLNYLDVHFLAFFSTLMVFTLLLRYYMNMANVSLTLESTLSFVWIHVNMKRGEISLTDDVSTILSILISCSKRLLLSSTKRVACEHFILQSPLFLSWIKLRSLSYWIIWDSFHCNG